MQVIQLTVNRGLILVLSSTSEALNQELESVPQLRFPQAESSAPISYSYDPNINDPVLVTQLVAMDEEIYRTLRKSWALWNRQVAESGVIFVQPSSAMLSCTSPATSR